MIRSFRHKGLADLYNTGRTAKVRLDLQARALRRLDALNAARELTELNVQGFDFMHSKATSRPATVCMSMVRGASRSSGQQVMYCESTSSNITNRHR